MFAESAPSHALDGKLLAAVSRSFYLTIRLLPRDLQSSVALSYLLARTSDTIADTASAPVEVRLRHLENFRRMIDCGATGGDIAALANDIRPDNADERDLLRELSQCLQWLSRSADQDQIRAVLGTITHGQELDLQRFGSDVSLKALRSAEELDEYTWLVAGCVGEFWTDLCFKHLRYFARVDLVQMRRWGISFGKGLQLVNILRDMPQDLHAGRCYLPADELNAAGIAPEDLLRTPEKARPVVNGWEACALEHLENGFRYICALRNYRVRIACILPWYLGLRTLILMRQQPPLETSDRLKVARREVRLALLWAPVPALSNSALSVVERCMRKQLNYFCKK